MSYQSYVDSLVQQQCVMAGVYDMSGNPWHDPAGTGSCKATPAEISAIKGAIELGSFSPDSPPTVEGVRYTALRVEKDESAAIKSKHEKTEDRQLVMVVKCKQFIMLGAMKGAAERNVMGVVESMGKYLENALSGSQ